MPSQFSFTFFMSELWYVDSLNVRDLTCVSTILQTFSFSLRTCLLDHSLARLCFRACFINENWTMLGSCVLFPHWMLLGRSTCTNTHLSPYPTKPALGLLMYKVIVLSQEFVIETCGGHRGPLWSSCHCCNSQQYQCTVYMYSHCLAAVTWMFR